MRMETNTTENGEIPIWVAKVINSPNVGIFYYVTGYKYDGEWVNNKKHGKGT